ncbi:hypothetical protein [Arthrobacter bambusae]|uniref:hypothetical protein n=1 Tax=Arthrobacter bambusae TaxID=1338426 RepID=UPI00277D4917|nr:hypothetical protein [Arthrobacter bambusae]MDQ0029522.1 hypothetical protein [Arthrobacter bambusae]MDQ0097182.1 hypothetical protein [Arthrobacter bambusae]
MITVLAWVTLLICLILTAIRIPSAIRGENRMMFVLFALFTLDILLSIEGPYLLIDAWLGGFNLCNLLLRFMLYATFLLLGIKVAMAFGSRGGDRAIRGPIGLAVLGGTAVLTAVFFFSVDTSGSTVGLTGLNWGPSLEAYAALGRFYPGYVAACLIPGMWRSIRNPGPVLLRTASATLLLGLVLLIVSQVFPLIPLSNTWLRPLINYSAALAAALGLGGIWLSKTVARRTSRRIRQKNSA